MTNDEKMMKYALALAEKARGNTSPNPMVGAVIVKNGEIVGEGFHHKAGTPHAEVHALQQAGEKAKGATIYVTLEPCSHYGRTPPCADAIIAAGITRVVAAVEDPNPKVSGQGFAKIKAAGIDVKVGILKKEALLLNEVFMHYITNKLPFVTLKTAATLDAKVATSTGKSKWITGEKARVKVHSLRAEHDAVITGIGTVLADDPELTVRHVFTERQPKRVVLDSELRIPLNAKILDRAAATLIFTANNNQRDKIKKLQELGAEVFTISRTNDGHLNLSEVLRILGERGMTSVMVEAGPKLVTNFLANKLVHKWYHFVAPKLFGNDAYSFYLSEGLEEPADALGFSIKNVENFEEDIMLIMYPKRGEE